MARRAAATVALAILGTALGACGGGGADAQPARARACDRLASPGRHAVQRLVDSLRPGEVGCLRRGTYHGSVTIRHGGRQGQPITLRAQPGVRARVVGAVTVTRRAANVIVRGLWLDGRGRTPGPSPIIDGRHIRFIENDVTNRHTSICFALGNPTFGVARDVTIQRNRIHDCGRLPATNFDQGIYVALARNTRIVGNWVYANADQGIQLYPDARGSYVAGNVIDGNGEGIIFGGATRVAASDNVVEGNVISNSLLRSNVEWHFDGPIGVGNLLRRNCIGGGMRDAGNGGIMEPQIGFTALNNVVAQPAFRGPDDYRLRAGSACRRVFSGNPDRIPGPAR